VNESDKRVVNTLLIEAHGCVEGAADAAVEKIGSQGTEALLIYPPKDVLSAEEDRALRSMKLSAVQQSALKKLIADACATAFFDWFSLIDAASAPEVVPHPEHWSGAWLIAPRDDEDREILHDAFYESYWAFEEATRGQQD
jgi:hypothetical protein